MDVTCTVLNIKVLGWLPAVFNFSCPDIIQTAEISLERHMLVFANEESNCTVKNIVLRSYEPLETTAFVADASPNRKQFCGPMELDTGNNLTQLASAGFHERDLASVKNFNGKELPL